MTEKRNIISSFFLECGVGQAQICLNKDHQPKGQNMTGTISEFDHQAIKAALDTAARFAKDHGSNIDVYQTELALHRLKMMKVDTGVTVNGVSVPSASFYSPDMAAQMQQHGCD